MYGTVSLNGFIKNYFTYKYEDIKYAWNLSAKVFELDAKNRYWYIYIIP